MTENILIWERCFSWDELISFEKTLFFSSFRRISFDRKNTILEKMYFVLEEITSVDKKLVCSIFGSNSFGGKFSSWKEFILLTNIISVDKKLMCSDPERIFVVWFVIREGIYFSQENNFCWQEINVLRSWKDFCWPLCYSGKAFWKNSFLLEINMLKSWKDFCWHFCFLFLKRFISVQ